MENDWESAVSDEPEELYALWYGAVAGSRTAWRATIEDGGLDVSVERGGPEWIVSRRRILIDVGQVDVGHRTQQRIDILLEENLKHTGHADVLREAIDGVRGNDPPPDDNSA